MKFKQLRKSIKNLKLTDSNVGDIVANAMESLTVDMGSFILNESRRRRGNVSVACCASGLHRFRSVGIQRLDTFLGILQNSFRVIQRIHIRALHAWAAPCIYARPVVVIGPIRPGTCGVDGYGAWASSLILGRWGFCLSPISGKLLHFFMYDREGTSGTVWCSSSSL